MVLRAAMERVAVHSSKLLISMSRSSLADISLEHYRRLAGPQRLPMML